MVVCRLLIGVCWWVKLMVCLCREVSSLFVMLGLCKWFKLCGFVRLCGLEDWVIKN